MEMLKLRQEDLVSSTGLHAEDPRLSGMEIHYYLQIGDFKGEIPHNGFGIEARLYEDSKLVDSCAVSDITASSEEVLGLIALLCKNTVTPVSLHDVVEDYLGA